MRRKREEAVLARYDRKVAKVCDTQETVCCTIRTRLS